MEKPVTYYVMHCIEGDECAIAYVDSFDAAAARMREEAARDRTAELSIWTNRGVMVAVWNRGEVVRVGAMSGDNLTEYARAGWMGNTNPHIWSSPAWYAHSLGAYLHASGRTIPRDVRMSRGSRVRVADMVFAHADKSGWERVS